MQLSGKAKAERESPWLRRRLQALPTTYGKRKARTCLGKLDEIEGDCGKQ